MEKLSREMKAQIWLVKMTNEDENGKWLCAEPQEITVKWGYQLKNFVPTEDEIDEALCWLIRMGMLVEVNVH